MKFAIFPSKFIKIFVNSALISIIFKYVMLYFQFFNILAKMIILFVLTNEIIIF